ncbi:lipoyl(octanoyl) transferase LipB [Eubacteriaceae bacterium ES3]|nr:lipoyl(octanoyl) transferase LipB [Eubacteriaceae bacterium ES3]
MKNTLNCLDLGLIDYHEAFAIQETIFKKVKENKMEDTLLFQENFPIITLGRGTHPENLLKTQNELKQMGIKITEVSRGGDISYHGPGQLVVSPIIHLEKYINGAHQFVRLLEQVVINVLSSYQLEGFRIKGKSGVWINESISNSERKIAALGIAISHGITFHGVSINLCPNLEHFRTIIPCGITDKDVTSFEAAGVYVPTLETLKIAFIEEFNMMFATESVEINLKKLYNF